MIARRRRSGVLPRDRPARAPGRQLLFQTRCTLRCEATSRSRAASWTRARAAGVWMAQRGRPTPAIDPARCAAHFGLRSQDWKSVCAWGECSTPRRPQFGMIRASVAPSDALEEALRRIDAGEPPEAVGLPNVGIPMPARRRSRGAQGKAEPPEHLHSEFSGLARPTRRS